MDETETDVLHRVLPPPGQATRPGFFRDISEDWAERRGRHLNLILT
jgi:hypothetical protein